MITKSEAILNNASDNLNYEVWMLRSIGEIFIIPKDSDKENLTRFTHSPVLTSSSRSTAVIKSDNSRDDSRNTIINNAPIEAFAVHARALLDFFSSLTRFPRFASLPSADRPGGQARGQAQASPLKEKNRVVMLRGGSRGTGFSPSDRIHRTGNPRSASMPDPEIHGIRHAPRAQAHRCLSIRGQALRSSRYIL
jgi:hypothetical protein